MIGNLLKFIYNLRHGKYFDKNGYRLGAFPKTVYIEPTNTCNLSCVYCPRLTVMKRPPGFMERTLFRRIINETGACGADNVHLCLFGEPLLHPEIVSFVDYAKKSGIPCIGLSTNGSLLTQDIARGLIEAKLDLIQICLDGARKDTYEKLRRGGDFDLVVRNVENFIGFIKTNKLKFPYIYLHIIESSHTRDELTNFVKKWSALLRGISHSRSFIKRYTTFAGQMQSDTISKENILCDFRVPCLALKEEIGIFWNGDIAACCYDVDNKFKVGSLCHFSLREIWESQSLKRMRALHIDGSLEELQLCQNCEYAHRRLTLSGIRKITRGIFNESRDRAFLIHAHR